MLAEALDHVADFDQATAVLRGACTVACLEPGYPAEVRQILLRAWLYSPNLDATQWYDFAAYLPLHPGTYFDLAEDFWCGDDIYPTGREWVADAILRWRGVPAVQTRIVSRCTHWLGFWHTDWHPFLGKPDADRLAQRRAVVNGNWSRLTDSERRLAAHSLLQAPTPHAPFIARLALLLISHGPRLAHVPGFIAWALSRAIMRLSDEIEEVAWCLRLNGYDAAETEAELLRRIDALLESPSEVGIRAARSLLWACGTPDAAARLAALPTPQLEESWSRPRLIEVDPLDPTALAPADLTPVTDRLAALDPSHLWRSDFFTAEDHQFDELEPVLARFAPLAVHEFYRRLFQSAPERQGMALRQLGWQVPQHLLCNGPEEARALEQARRSLLPLLDGDPHDARVTEGYILITLLVYCSIEEQLNLLLDRPENALDLNILEHVIADVPGELAKDLDALWETMIQTPISPADMARAIVLRMRPTDPAIPELERASIEPSVETALRTIRVFGRGPSTNELQSFFEQLDPGVWTYQRRNFQKRIAELIAEARQAGHLFLDKPIRGYALAKVVAQHPELVEKWTVSLGRWETVPWETAEFYRALCAALGPTDPDRAADLLARLRSASTVWRVTYRPWNVNSLTWLAFTLAPSPKVDEVRERMLDEANTDELLFQIALAAQASGATDWLARIIRRDLMVPGIYPVARALTLIGFLDERTLLDEFRDQLNGRMGCLEDVTREAGHRLERNHRARAWFAEFLARRDPVEAWAAFRLFLRCVDRRFHLWREAMCKRIVDLPPLWHQQVSINNQDIVRAAAKNEGNLSEILYGRRIPKNEIAPWYRTPPMANIT